MLIEHYLNEYVQAGGPVVTPEAFRIEVSALAWAHRVTVLSWLAKTGQMERVREVLDYLRGYVARL